MNDTSYNRTKINDTYLIESLINGININKTLKIKCIDAGGFLNGTGCATPDYRADIFFFSVLLFIFTFCICLGLQEFRRTAFFPTKVNTNNKKKTKISNNFFCDI